MPKVMKLGAAPGAAVHTKRYEGFRGVDFSTDPSKVEEKRSPWAVNVVMDTGGFPEKRPGWRRLRKLDGAVNGIFRYRSEEAECLVVHAGTKLYKWNGGEDAPVQVKEGLHNGKSRGMMFKDKLVILTGEEYLYFAMDEEGNAEAGDPAEDAYAPFTSVQRGNVADWRDPGTGYEGTAYQTINMVGKYRRNSFIIDTTAKNSNGVSYVILDKEMDVGTVVPTDVKVTLESGADLRELGCSFMWIKPGMSTDPITDDPDYPRNVLWFSMESFIAAAGNERRITVKFPARPEEEVKRRIHKCTLMGAYGSRVFFAGNPEYPNTDWHSELDDPFYISDLGYTEIGVEGAKIIGYLRSGENQVIVKEDGVEDATVYLRSATMTEGGMIFPIKQGGSSIGGVAPGSFRALMDDPVFLSRDGIFAVEIQAISGERVLRQRSTRVNAKLCREAAMEEGEACVWRGYYLLAVNGNVYLADARQRTSARNETGDFEYEWLYWEGVPARCWLADRDDLFFGTEDGGLCRMNTDLADEDGNLTMQAYADWPEGLTGEAAAICAEWSTKFGDDGDFMVLKQMPRKGSGVYVKGYRRGDIQVIVRTDKDFGRVLADRQRGIFNWNDIDFNHFVFDTLPQGTVAVNKKVKKYRLIQVICRNDKPQQGFGLLGIVRRFITGYYSK